MIGLSKLFHRRKPEVRESYTDQVVARLLASAGVASDGGALAAIETASHLWGAGLASATVKPSNLALSAVSASVLDSIGRSLCRTGESLHVIDVRNGKVMLTPCGSWIVTGSDNPSTWSYGVTLSGPTATRTVTIPAEAVVHVRYSPDPARPWIGRSPMSMALDTARVAGLLEHATSEELNFTQQQILSPRRNQGEYGTDSLTPDLITKIVEAFAAHTGSGAFVVPGDLEPRRLGPDPPDSFPLLRDRFEHSILSMHGIPPALIAAVGSATGSREAFRQLLHGTIKPLGLLLAEELQAKLDPSAALDFSALRAGDIAGTSRAFGSLVTAGLTPQSAAAGVGLDGVEVRPA